MHEETQNADPVCRERVSERPHYIHSHECGRKAKWLVDYGQFHDFPVCGTHVEWYRRNKVAVRLIDGSGAHDAATQ